MFAVLVICRRLLPQVVAPAEDDMEDSHGDDGGGVSECTHDVLSRT